MLVVGGVSGHVGEFSDDGIRLLNLVTSTFGGIKGAIKDGSWSLNWVFAGVTAYKFNSSRKLSKLNTCAILTSPEWQATMDDLILPEVEAVRKRIEEANKKEAKFCLMAAYLFCARASEIIGATNRYDIAHNQTVARGPTGQDVKLETFELGDIKTDAAIFTVRTAKRDGKIRKIALPLEKIYEPWTEQLYNYYCEQGSDKVFPFTRQKAWEYAQETFAGLKYPIEKYSQYDPEEPKPTPIRAHMKPFRTHALRHLRATELIETFGFTGFDLSVYGGWTLRSMVGVGSAMSRYAHLDWRRYFPKLLKKRF